MSGSVRNNLSKSGQSATEKSLTTASLFGRTPSQIAVLGSAFDPPHRGHMDVVAQALVQFDRVILVPSAAHAFGKKMAPFEARLEMIALALFELLPEAANRVEVSAVEGEILRVRKRLGPVYTYDLLVHLASHMVGAQFHFVVGPDNAAPEKWTRFYQSDRIQAEFGVFAAQQRLHIRSSQCRQQIKTCCKENKSLTALYSWLARGVCNYITTHRLYE